MSTKGYKGRAMYIKDDTGTRIAGINAKTVSIEREGINVTTDDEDGFQTFLGEAGTIGLNISGSGFARAGNLTIIEKMLDPDTEFEDWAIEFPWGKQASGEFRIGTGSLTGETAEAVAFEIEIQSSGEFTYEDVPS
jgi:predicted secreted protein